MATKDGNGKVEKPSSRLRMIKLTHLEEDIEIKESYVNSNHIVQVYYSESNKCTCVILLDSSLNRCRESVDRILAQMRT